MSEPGAALQVPPGGQRPKGHPFLRALAVAGALLVGVAVAFFAALVALVGVLAALLVVVLRRRPAPTGAVTLEGRRTPDGWVAESASR